MTLQEHVKALPEEGIKFFRAIMAVVDAGRAAGVPAKEWAKTYADVYRGVNDLIEGGSK